MGKIEHLKLVAMFLGWMLVTSNVYSKEENLDVSWYGTKRYKELVKNSPISADEGRKIIQNIVIQNKLSPSKYGNVPEGPSFIYDNFMFFSFELKGEVSLQGFYLNTDSREVEYRRTSDKVYIKKSYFKHNNKIKRWKYLQFLRDKG
ncbi:hypothetical protein [Agarilytica rhodophyticola]|uniref:hypothetical protein n=1 Tax=Agarilytica rhodophyticola TaxID=1737490 RepID=UPI000CD95B59|nr:hypothetical protein [Agarilytica rhodophyticola]